jgi:hypothetical protein
MAREIRDCPNLMSGAASGGLSASAASLSPKV